MSKNTNTYQMDRNGSLVFQNGETVHNMYFRPKNLFEKPGMAYFVMLLCALLDFTLFYQLLSKALYDSKWVLYMTTVGLLIGFDFAPVYLGMKIREAGQGYRVNKPLLYALAGSFVIAFIINFYLRIVMKDVALPDLSAATSLLGSVENETAENPLALAFAIFAALMPTVTSLCSYGIGYATSNPLKDEYKVLDEEDLCLEEGIRQTASILQEYEADADYYGRICQEDKARYEECLAMTYEKALQYADYVRERIKEYLTDDLSGRNELSREQYDRLANLLSEKRADDFAREIAAMKSEAEDADNTTLFVA